MDACIHGLHHIVDGDHCVKDRAQNGERGSFTTGHLSNVGGSGDGEVFSGNSDEFAGAMKPSIYETILTIGIGSGRGSGVVPSKGGGEDGMTRLCHGGGAQGREA